MSDTEKSARGILLRARNGDVIGFDETGLRMQLSDEVIADIGGRLPAANHADTLDAALLGDIDAWDLRQRGDWYVFSARLPGKQGARQFRRLVAPAQDAQPDIVADPSGALFAILSLGGTRRAMTGDEPQDFPFHVVTTGDDLGPAGAAGTLDVTPNATLQNLTEQTRDSLIAHEIVARRMAAHRALPVIYARSETDASSSIAALADGPALRNFERSVTNLCGAAATLGLPAKVLAVGLDFTLEDVQSDAATWQDGLRRIMQRVTDIFADHGLRKPLFAATFDAGTALLSDHPVLRAQWDLAWNRGGHDHVFSAPGYMFAQDEFGRPTDAARRQMAEMDACAIEARNADLEWTCPVLLLAEREPDPSVIRCRGQALAAFVLDRDDPLNAGKSCGFRLEHCTNGAVITQVAVDEDDHNDLLITLDKPAEGADLTLCYALGHAPSTDGMPANRGALRDTWSTTSRTGAVLHRWALPAALPVH